MGLKKQTMSLPIKIVIKALDDQEATILAIEQLFKGNDLFDVQCFTKAEPFLLSITKEVDLIITDFRVDEFDAAQTIRDLVFDFPGISIIVISAYFTVEILQELISCRVNETVIKNGNWIPELYRKIMGLVPSILKKHKLLNDDY